MCEPRNASSSATRSAPRRSPRSGRERAAPRRRSWATVNPTAAIPTISKAWPSHQPRSRYVEKERCRQRRREPDDADGDDEIRAAKCQPVGAERAPEEDAVEGEAAAEDDPCWRRARLRHARDECRIEDRCRAETEDEHDARCEQPQERSDGSRASQGRERAESEDGAADRQRRATCERGNAVRVEQDAWGGEAVEAEERRHDRERAADEHCVTVLLTRPGDGQRDR